MRELTVVAGFDAREIVAWKCAHCEWIVPAAVVQDEEARQRAVLAFQQHDCRDYIPREPRERGVGGPGWT